jgi:Uma2 family endonuclease
MSPVELEEDLTGLKQFLRLPEARPALDYYGGRAIQKMSPKLRHSVISRELTLKLVEHSRPEKLGDVFPELRCTFRGGSYVFDLSFFVQEHLPKPDSDERADVTIAPDLVIEILSPGQTVGELKKKMGSAIRGGVRLGWLFNPPREQVLILQEKQKPEILKRGDILTGKDVLPGFALPIDEIFGWLDQG